MEILLSVVFCTILLASGQSYVLPVDKCHIEDTKCVVPAFQKILPDLVNGIPELGVERLDILDIEFELAGLKFTLTNGRIKGLKNAVVDNVVWDVKKQRLEVMFHVDSSMKGQYTADGQILVLPIRGNGDFKLKLKNMSVKLTFDYDAEKRGDDKTYIKFKKYKFEFDVIDGAVYNFTNLFNGNKELSDNVINFINENWKDISNEFGTPVVKVITEKLMKNINQFYDKVALEDTIII